MRDWVASVNWETVLVASIPAFLALIGVVYNGYRSHKNKVAENAATAQMRREPTWPELVAENRSLRADLDNQETRWEERYKKLEDRVGALEEEKRLTEWAARSILYDTYGQWQGNPPVFDKDALDTVPHLVHPAWRWNYRTA